VRESIELEPVVARFNPAGHYIEAIPHGSGHINETYLVRQQDGHDEVRYILQLINQYVFKQPEQICYNLSLVLPHKRARLAQEPNLFTREVLESLPADDGRDFVIDEKGNFWRLVRFVEGASTYDIIQNPEQAYQAARGFGEFQYLLHNFDPACLHEIIPDFHHTPRRVEAFEKSVEADTANRAAQAREAIDFAEHHKSFASRVVDGLADGSLPLRTTHNDTKLNNVMLDNKTGKPVCVIDLDTVMPGSSLYDFGDMMRTATCFAAEDELDLDKIQLEMEVFKAISRGYLSIAREFLTPNEIDLLAFSGQLITYEIGIRFLTDHLNGDKYFKIHRADHNLDRACAQFKLVECFMQHQDAMQRIVAEA
jgi:Ser/Thr protein kinase RdoA (MazF antagonist)